ncbi:MAG: WD40 repeat domain-containing protein, partial [Pseudomonadota bacterium]|nr:WD40 repeat domain-containing protein [Pseudomonadota bacterium]
FGVAFSPDGAYLAVVHQSAPYLTVIDTADWSVVPGAPAMPGSGQTVAFSPDGAYLAVAHTSAPYLTVIDTTDWSVVPGAPAMPSVGFGVAFSPDGDRFASCGGSQLVAYERGYLIVPTYRDTLLGQVNSVAFSP